ncbi:MAG: PAS domain-containing protein, partial [Flavobacteriales bacterium]|nr:PAS domain-containing protein [Flavobacteriales bacterium]
MTNESVTIRAEDQIRILQRENNLLNSIIQGANDSIYAKDLEGRYLTINEAGAALLDKTVDDVVGKTDEVLFGKEESESFMRHDTNLFRTGEPVVYVSHTESKGDVRYFRTSKSPLRDSSGRVIGLIGVSRDITTAHLAQKKYQFIFENAPIAFWEEDFSEVKSYLDKLKQDGVEDLSKHFEQYPQTVEDCIERIRILNVNGTTLKMYDTDDKEMFVKKLRRNFTPDSEKIFSDEFVALAEGKTSFQAEGTLISDDGGELNVLFKLNVLP